MNPYTLAALWTISCGALIWMLVLSERIRGLRLERDFALADARAYAADSAVSENEASQWCDSATQWRQRSADLEVSVGLLDAELERVGRGGAA